MERHKMTTRKYKIYWSEHASRSDRTEVRRVLLDQSGVAFV